MVASATPKYRALVYPWMIVKFYRKSTGRRPRAS